MKENEIGYISNYYGKISVAAIEITKGTLHVGDMIRVSGFTDDFTEEVKSMQIEHSPVEVAKAGDSIGIKLSQKARKRDKIYKVIED